MISRRDESAWMKSHFYRDRYRKALRAIMVTLGIMILLILGVIYCVVFTSPLSFYGTATTGQIIPMGTSEGS